MALVTSNPGACQLRFSASPPARTVQTPTHSHSARRTHSHSHSCSGSHSPSEWRHSGSCSQSRPFGFGRLQQSSAAMAARYRRMGPISGEPLFNVHCSLITVHCSEPRVKGRAVHTHVPCFGAALTWLFMEVQSPKIITDSFSRSIFLSCCRNGQGLQRQTLKIWGPAAVLLPPFLAWSLLCSCLGSMSSTLASAVEVERVTHIKD